MNKNRAFINLGRVTYLLFPCKYVTYVETSTAMTPQEQRRLHDEIRVLEEDGQPGFVLYELRPDGGVTIRRMAESAYRKFSSASLKRVA